MSDMEKLIAASAHVESLTTLLDDNPWQSYLYNHISPIKYELDRQLTNLKESDKVEE